MKFIDKIKFAFNDLINRKGRSLLTIIAVAIGALLLIVLLGVGDGVISKMQEIGKSFGDINTIIVYPQDASKTNETLTVAMGGEMSEDFKEVSDDETSDNEEKINKEDDESFKKISSSDIEAISKVNGVKKGPTDRVNSFSVMKSLRVARLIAKPETYSRSIICSA